MTIHTGLNAKEYKRFLIVITFFRNRTAPIAFVFIVLAGTILSFRGRSDITLSAILIHFLILSFLFFIVLTWIIRLKSRSVIRLTPRSYQNIARIGYMITFNESGFQIYIPQMDANNRWQYSDLFEILESREFVILFINENQCLPIRKKDIPEFETWRKHIKEHVDSKYRQTLFYHEKL